MDKPLRFSELSLWLSTPSSALQINQLRAPLRKREKEGGTVQVGMLWRLPAARQAGSKGPVRRLVVETEEGDGSLEDCGPSAGRVGMVGFARTP
jgi:hypothetical protein